MSFVISSFITFPDITWWASMPNTGGIYFDKAEHFEKMTRHNRYYIAGANGLIQLSIPLEHGRNQRAAIKDIKISNRDRWQIMHWRTLTSVYKRSPYFDFYEDSLKILFEKPFIYLTDFNTTALHWLKEQLKVSFEEKYTDVYIKTYPEADIDFRRINRELKYEQKAGFPEYYQLFRDRTGFLPNLSILDLLFSEGPYAMQWINTNNYSIMQWLNGSM